jgi:sugar lactone lactonase YvrE
MGLKLVSFYPGNAGTRVPENDSSRSAFTMISSCSRRARGWPRRPASGCRTSRITNKRKLIDAGPGTPDGFRCDVDGKLWCGWGMGQEGLDGVHVFNSDGKLIGRINLPERCAG